MEKKIKKTYRVSQNFIDKMSTIIELEKDQPFPLTQAQLLDEMIDVYYSRYLYKRNELDLLPITKEIVNDSIGIVTKEIAKFHNALLDAVYKKLDEVSNNGDKNK